MEPNLTAHYLGIATDRARLSRQAERGWLVEQAIATRPTRSATSAVPRRVGVVFSAVATRRPFVIRRLLTHIHPARQSAQT